MQIPPQKNYTDLCIWVIYIFEIFLRTNSWLSGTEIQSIKHYEPSNSWKGIVQPTTIPLSWYLLKLETCPGPGSNLTQVQSGVTLPLTNPGMQGYAIRLSSECILRPVVAGLRLHISLFWVQLYGTPMCRWVFQFFVLVKRDGSVEEATI